MIFVTTIRKIKICSSPERNPIPDYVLMRGDVINQPFKMFRNILFFRNRCFNEPNVIPPFFIGTTFDLISFFMAFSARPKGADDIFM